jgi:hypothetical protein
VCNGDDPCGYYYESAIRDVCLQAGTTYWLVVDGWSPTYAWPGSYYDVTFSRTVDPCTSDAECDDLDICNGIEECVDGCCVQGDPFCERWEDCDPILQECFNRYDPCIAWVTDEALPGSFSPQCYNGCYGSYFADDIQLHPGTGRELISYQVMTQARNVLGAYPNCDQDEPLDTPYAIQTDLLTVWDSGDEQCYPNEEALIAGASCSFDPAGLVLPGGSGGDVNLCEPNGGLPTGIDVNLGSAATCGVDFYLGVISWNDGAGVSLSTNNQEQFLGGPALDDDLGQSVVAFQDCDGDTALGTFGLGAFSAPTVSDARNVFVCTVPSGPCCYPEGGCDVTTEEACTAAGGILLGLSDASDVLTCDDFQNDTDNFYGTCDNCPDVSNPSQRDCDGDGEGDACEADPADQDDDNDGCCNGVDVCPNDPTKCDTNFCGCGVEDVDADGDGCYDGPTCVPFDECPDDANKCAPGVCGCGVPDVGDDDGDGFLNCVDECAGVDDAVFAPGCVGAIPTVSEWGIAVLALLLLAAGKVYFGRRTAVA